MKYLVTAAITISISTVVEAKDEYEALQKAQEQPLCSLGSPEQHGKTAETAWIHSGELDGEPMNLKAEESE